MESVFKLKEVAATQYTEEGYVIEGLNTENPETATMTELEVFQTYKGKKVWAINANAFKGNKVIEKITLWSGMQTIDDSAFEGCTALTEVVTGAGLKAIESSAFSGCSALTSLILYENLERIGSYAFRDCGLTSVAIPSTLKVLGQFAFGSSKLQVVKFANSTTAVETPISIGLCAFEECANLNKVTLSNTVWNLPYGAFLKCTKLATIEFSEGLTSINDSAFIGCASLETIDLPESLEIIKTKAFSGCENLSSVTFKEGLQTIEGNAFENCVKLTTVNLPASLKSVASGVDGAFSGCSEIATLTVADSSTPSENAAAAFWADGNCLVQKRSSSNPNSTNIIVMGCKNSTLPVGAEMIGHSVFKNATYLTTLTIPSSITYIDAEAFNSCSITELTIEGDFVEVSYRAFQYCQSLQTVSFNGWVTINDNAFENCSWLTSVNFASGGVVNSYAFTDCTDLADVNLGSVNYIGEYAFGSNGSSMNIKNVMFSDQTDWNNFYADSTAFTFADWDAKIMIYGYDSYNVEMALGKLKDLYDSLKATVKITSSAASAINLDDYRSDFAGIDTDLEFM